MLPALAAGAYRYRFTVDGVATSDPANPATSESNGNAWSLFYVAGAALMDTQRVAHGSVAEVHYHSTALGRTRRMHVYTPPGYERNRDAYPVFYLLHGAFDGDDSWSTVGRAGFILDNLIAAGDARPMIVVMPDGHTSRFGGGGAAGLNMADFVREFNADIKPYVETTYRIRTGRAATAIAGLSMGGAQTLDIAVGDLKSYGYVGVFSSGVFGIADNADWENGIAPSSTTPRSNATSSSSGSRRARTISYSTRRKRRSRCSRSTASTSSTKNRPAATLGSTGEST